MGKRFTKDNDAEIAALYQQGLTTYAIGTRFGVSPNPITRALRRQGVPLRHGGRQPAWNGTPDERAQVVVWYEGGDSLRTISRRLGCDLELITRTLEAEGIKRRPHGTDIRAFTDEQAAKVAQEYQAGAILTDLAAKYGTTHVTIRNYLVRQGVKLRPSGVSVFWTDERKAEAARRYLAGESQQEIADSWGVAQAQVSTMIRSLGVGTRKPQWHRGNPNWKGGRHIDGHGYVQVKPTEEDRALVPMMSTGYVLEHRLVMARHLGRPLLKTETVHHINGNKQDNDPDNLQLRQGRHGKGVVLACMDCGSHRVEAAPLK